MYRSLIFFKKNVRLANLSYLIFMLYLYLLKNINKKGVYSYLKTKSSERKFMKYKYTRSNYLAVIQITYKIKLLIKKLKYEKNKDFLIATLLLNSLKKSVRLKLR